MIKSLPRRIVVGFLFAMVSSANMANIPAPAKQFPFREKLDYRVEWRLITAGIAHIDIAPLGANWQTRLNLESAGMVTKLYRVSDNYRSLTNDHFCGINATLEAQ